MAQTKLILDTDIGDDIDDAYALASLASLPDANLVGVTTCFGQTRERAQVAAKLLVAAGRADVPISAGRRGDNEIRGQYAWARGFESPAILKEDAVAFLHREIERAPGELTIVGIGPLMNLADLFDRHPADKAKIKGVVLMGGSFFVGYDGSAPPIPEWNIRCDVDAARAVVSSGVPLAMAGLDVTSMMRLEGAYWDRLFKSPKPLVRALGELTKLWGGEAPVLFDVVAAAHAAGRRFCDEKRCRIQIESDGLTRVVDGEPNATVLTNPRKDALLEWCVDLLSQA